MNPITRVEVFLDAAAGNEQALPDPVTREEVFLKAIVDAQSSGGGGGGGSSGGGVLMVGMDTSTGALDKTWQEIHDATLAVISFSNDSEKNMYYVTSVWNDEVAYGIDSIGTDVGVSTNVVFSTDSASGYPVRRQSGGGGSTT